MNTLVWAGIGMDLADDTGGAMQGFQVSEGASMMPLLTNKEYLPFPSEEGRAVSAHPALPVWDTGHD